MKHSDLEHWLRERYMSTKEFCAMVGCSRTVIWKVKNGWLVSAKTAKKIIELTGGKVSPHYYEKGN